MSERSENIVLGERAPASGTAMGHGGAASGMLR